MLIGVLAGSICFYATQLVKSYFKVDDSLDVFPVHGVGGILGIIMLSLVGTPGGFLGNGSTGFDNTTLAQLLIQLEGIFVICAWTGIATYVILKILNIFVDIRVTKDEEEEGLDVSLHNEQGYNL